MPSLAPTRSAAPGEALRLDHVCFRYADQDGMALHDVSFSVAQGEMVVVMGATGAGKTTLAKCLNRTVPAFHPGTLSGHITICGRQLQDEGVADLAGIVGLVSQDFEAQLFATNVVQEVVFGMEQLGIPRDEMRRRVPFALGAVGLTGFERRDPTTLSGGEKQRLAIAATLALQPQVLVFDEPTTDLDPLGKLDVFAVLADMRRHGYTLVVIEHETAAAERADRVIILSSGRIVADDRPERLLARVDFLRRHGIRPPDLAEVAHRFRLAIVPPSIEDAVTALRPHIAPHEEQARTRPPSTPAPASGDEPPPLVQADGLVFAYDTGAPALNGVSLRIDAGEFLALIGQNGSGKTTVAKHLTGLLRPSAGHVLIRGMDLRRLPITEIATTIGYVFQNPDHQLFTATVYDEVAFGPRNIGLDAPEIDARVRSALASVGLGGLEDHDPFLFSKGHRQRLAVASLLALQPKLLILDEPTTGLDYGEQRRMMDLLAELHDHGTAIVIITHSPWVVAEYAQRGILMHEGRVLFDGALRALLQEDALLARAHFCAPEITRLGRHFGRTPLSVDEFAVSAIMSPPP